MNAGAGLNDGATRGVNDVTGAAMNDGAAAGMNDGAAAGTNDDGIGVAANGGAAVATNVVGTKDDGAPPGNDDGNDDTPDAPTGRAGVKVRVSPLNDVISSPVSGHGSPLTKTAM
jgi:hypothetical protein